MVYTRLQKKLDGAAIEYTRLQKRLDADKKAATPATTTPTTATLDAVPLSIAQIKTRSKSHAIEQETIRHDTMLAAMGLLALHDMHDPANAGWSPNTQCAEYGFQNRNDYTCNIL